MFQIQCHLLAEQKPNYHKIQIQNRIAMINAFNALNNMTEIKQKNKGQKNIGKSIQVQKINPQSHPNSKKVYLRAKSQPYADKQFINKQFDQAIKHSPKLKPNMFQTPKESSIIENKEFRMAKSSCEKGNDSQGQSQSLSERLLAVRAKQFVNRLRKEKKYRQGRFLLKKKEEEKKHSNIFLKRLEQQRYKMAINKQHKMARAMQNILKHEENINSRLSINLQRIKQLDHRFQTQPTQPNNQDYQLIKSFSRPKMNDQAKKVQELQRKIKILSQKIRQMSIE